MIRPPGLPSEARIALVAPAGPLQEEAVDRALNRIRGWGWEPLLGTHARGRRGYLSGTDDERALDLQFALRDGGNDAIWFLRGGYGTMRIIDRIDWTPLLDRPRPVLGFSDNTAFHLALQRLGMISFHGPHPTAEDLPQYAWEGIRRMLIDRSPLGAIPFPPGSPEHARTLVPGIAEGRLLGGNLSLLAALIGTRFAPAPQGSILFFEEVGEPGYRIDRLLTQLRLAGVLDHVAGIAVGAISDSPEPNGDAPPAAEVILEAVRHLGIPVAIGFPFGHVPDNWTLPLGVEARLDASAGTLELLEPAVR